MPVLEKIDCHRTDNEGTYAALNTFLGGNTLPDFRGYAPWTLDNQGGVAAGRITVLLEEKKPVIRRAIQAGA